MIHPQLITKKRTISAALTTTVVDIYTTPQQYEAEVASILFSNHTGATAVTLTHYDAAQDTDFLVLGSYGVPSAGIFQLENALWMAKGDKLRCSAAANDQVTMTIVVKELYSPQQF